MADMSWKQIETLFEETLARPASEREAFLEDQPVSEDLREEVRSLLDAYEEGGNFFEDLAEAAHSTPGGGEPGAADAGPSSDPLGLEGAAISRYLVEEYLGGGGMGVVYKARDAELDRPVALKFLPPHLNWNEEAEERFAREARAAAALDHSNVATVYEIGEAALGEKGEERRFIAMAYYEGETLKEKLSRQAALSPEEVLSYAEQIAEGLAWAHAAGVIHRDIKPANVLVTGRGRVKLLDFGIAKLKGDQSITRTGATLGTVAYMAPEQIQGERVDQKADLFSFGVLLYEMLTGRHPFPGAYREAVAYQIVNKEVEPPSSHRPEVPSDLEEVVLRCLEKEPGDRYGSAEEVLEDLQEAAKTGAGSTLSDAEDAGSVVNGLLSGRLWRGNRRRTGFGVVGALAVVILLMGWWFLGGSVSEEAAEALPGGGGLEVSDRSIAILPFDALGRDEPGPFAEGIHEGLLTRLSNVAALQVISRTSVERYRGTELSLPAVAESLDVRWIVEGSVQEAGGQVQVSAQLVDPQTDVNAWADRYQRELTAENLFVIQEEIAEEIAGALEAELAAGEQERIASMPTEDLEAYRLYVQGRQALARFSFSRPETAFEAARYFRRAVERDSSYALAWAGLADAMVYADYYDEYYDWPDTLRTPTLGISEVDKEEAARRALELNPDLAEAHASLGLIRLRSGDGPEAIRRLRRAMELKPSYWEAHHWLGHLYLMIGRPQAALDHLTLALELNPEHAFARHTLYDAYLAAGEAEKSLEEARLQQRMGLERLSAVGGRVRALKRLGRLEEARRLAEEQIEDSGPETPWGGWFRAYLVGILAAEGDTTGARVYLDQLQAAEVHPSMLAHAYAAMGNTDRALETYGRMDEEDWRRVGPSVELRYGIDFDVAPLREDPRYEELIEEANRAWNLHPDGSIPGEESAASGSDG